MSAAIARSQLTRLEENNRRRNQNIEYLCEGLEPLGIHTFRPPHHIQRVYFELLVRADPKKVRLPIPALLRALKAEGCHAAVPRYPLLHQQPFFTEGAFKAVMRPGSDVVLPDYAAVTLPFTEQANASLIKLPSFPNAKRDLLDQYLEAFEKVLSRADELAGLPE